MIASHPVEWVLGGAVAKFAPTDAMRFEPGFVVELLGKDDVHHAERERGIGGGFGLDVQIGRTRGQRLAGIDDDDVQPLRCACG